MRRCLALVVLLLPAACSAPDYTPVRDWARTASLAADFPAGRLPPPRSVDVREGAMAMREALATYLAALGRLADDGVLPYPENPFVDLAPQAGRAGTGGEQPVAELGALLRRATRQNWQAPRMREAITAADPSVQALVRAMAAAIARNAEPNEPPDIARARAQYATLILRIGEDHALLRARADDITDEDVVELIHAAQDRMTRSLLALPRPTLPAAETAP
ncbi:hypothetical protein KPL78_04530 [Roseomonas sp. HJA6]|uniref:DUF305 domain-containing protein n=1 Tax=Roseomonas alba TaxID=2846776 RepID=A0ABS7A710_9PROT|nr:hypothetical protein [Neoroseomonas alba]MBW6397100.1 hypothetical protein [Neoroseomonas alba]